MRASGILVICCFILGIGFALFVYLAGVDLSLENQNGQEIQNVKVSYDPGALLADRIPDKGMLKKSLGKIGEGATFDVRWQEISGLSRLAQFGIYFEGFFGYHTIRIRLLPQGEDVLFDGERLHKPSSQ